MFALRKRGKGQEGNAHSPAVVHIVVANTDMQLELTDRAADVIRRKGGTAVVDLLEPFG